VPTGPDFRFWQPRWKAVRPSAIKGQNVTVEYHWLEGQYDRLSSLMADLVGRRVAVIVTPGSDPASIAAKAATTTIPIVFGVSEDPVKLGLCRQLYRPPPACGAACGRRVS
jgi:ABC-type uncharacterized transport system substrate-binding protein